MKIVHLVQYFEPGYVGGMQRYVAELARAQQGRGLDVSVLTVTLPQRPLHERNGASSAHWMRVNGSVPVISRSSWATFYRTPIYPSLFMDVRRLEADVLHLHGPSPWFEAALLLARPLPGKLVVTLHNTFPQTTALQRQLARMAQRLLHATLTRADAVIAPHRDFLDDLIPEEVSSRIAHKVSLLPPGVDRDQFHPLGLARDEKCVLFVAHVRPEKGLHVLVEAMEMLPGLRLEVVATVSYESAYFKRVRRDAERRLGRRVRFILDPDSETILQAYNRAACLVVPSLGLESWNLVLLEAASCGTACVRTDIPGLSWAKFALAAAPGKPAQIARAIQAAIAQRNDLGARARSAADGYSWERTSGETLAAYERAGAAS